MITTSLLAVLGIPSVSSTGPGDPEITDTEGDMNPLAFFQNTPVNQPVFQNASAYDILATYVLQETATHFWIEHRVRDLPDEGFVPEPVPDDLPSPVGPNATNPSTDLVAFMRIKGVDFEVHASLNIPTAGGIVDSYSIRRGDESIALAGSYDVYDDTVIVQVPKSLVGNPSYGDKLTKFRAEGRFNTTPLDFAPDAVNYDIAGQQPTPGLVTVLLNKLTGQQVVEPRFGRDYDFGQYPGSVLGDVSLTSATPARSVRAGEAAVYTISIRNSAPATDSVMLTLSSAPTGFAHQVNPTRVTLAPGQQQTVTLTVSSAPSARGAATSTLHAVSQLGDQASISFQTAIGSSSGTDRDTSRQNPDTTITTSPDKDKDVSPGGGKSKGMPGFELVLALAALGAAWTTRRRK